MAVFRYGDLFARDKPVFGSLMNLHNLSTMSRYVAALNAIASQPNMTPERYSKEVVAPYGERAVGLFDYLVIAMDRGLMAAEREAMAWSGERSYNNLFPTPTGRCREVLVPKGTAADRQAACPHSNLLFLPHYLDRAALECLPRSIIEWFDAAKEAGIMP